jgi:single-stranded DNA-binding protein
MFLNINRVLLAGRIGDYGVKISWLPSGKPELTFSMILEKPAGEKVFKTFVAIQVYGARVEALAESLEPGDLVYVEGQLGYKASRQTETDAKAKRPAPILAVSTFDVTVLQRAQISNVN